MAQVSTVAIVPAAGKAERFGDQKLLVDVGGEPLLARTVRSLLDAGVGAVIVVLAQADAERIKSGVSLLADPRVGIAINPDPSRGMFSTIQIGVAAADGDPIVLLPGDMPFVAPGTVSRVVAACLASRAIVVPRYRGRRGHPVAFPASARDAILTAPPSQNLSEILKTSNLPREELDVDDPGIVRDVDRPGDL
jgi:molybdenum cofactor cytidylyltransferase